MKSDLSAEVRNSYVSIFQAVLKPDRVDDFLSSLDEVMPHSAAEDEIIRFEVFQSHENPRAFTIVDMYHDEAAFKRHSATPHIARFGKAISGCFEATSSTGTYKVHAGIPSKF